MATRQVLRFTHGMQVSIATLGIGAGALLAGLFWNERQSWEHFAPRIRAERFFTS
jgi:hypothetical protein